jgi:hypothetical protein
MPNRAMLSAAVRIMPRRKIEISSLIESKIEILEKSYKFANYPRIGNSGKKEHPTRYMPNCLYNLLKILWFSSDVSKYQITKNIIRRGSGQK